MPVLVTPVPTNSIGAAITAEPAVSKPPLVMVPLALTKARSANGDSKPRSLIVPVLLKLPGAAVNAFVAVGGHRQKPLA